MSWITGSAAPWTMLLGGLMIVSAWLLWRGHTWGTRSRRTEPLDEARRAMAERERTASARVSELEVRLHDFQREVEGHVETRIRVLDQLIADADARIEALVHAVAQARGLAPEEPPEEVSNPPVFRIGPTDTHPPLEVVELVRLLRGAGFDIEEVARLSDQPVAIVLEILGDDHASAA